MLDCLEKNRGLRGDPVQKAKNGNGCIRSYWPKDRRDWVTTAENVGIWHRGVEKEAGALENAWRRAERRQFNVRRQCEAGGLRSTSRTSANSDSVTITLTIMARNAKQDGIGGKSCSRRS